MASRSARAPAAAPWRGASSAEARTKPPPRPHPWRRRRRPRDRRSACATSTRAAARSSARPRGRRPDAPDAPGSPPASAPRPNAAAPPPPKNVVVATVVGWRGAAARGRAGAALRVFLVARGGRRRLVGDVPLRLHLPGAVATGTRVATTARPGDRHVVLDVVGPADDVVASRKLGLGALAADGDAAAAAPRWVRFAKDAQVMLGVELSARAAAAAPPSPPPPAVSREAAPAAPPAAPPRRRRRTDWLSAGELRAGPDPARARAGRRRVPPNPGGRGPVPARRRRGRGGRRRGGRRGARRAGAALRLAVGAARGRRRCVSTATRGPANVAWRCAAAPRPPRAPRPSCGRRRSRGRSSRSRSPRRRRRAVRRAGWRRPNRTNASSTTARSTSFRAGAGVVARRVALAGAAVDRVAVRGATLVLAVAPPDAPGRILLDASGLSPDAGEAFAATVFAAAEAPRGRVIP